MFVTKREHYKILNALDETTKEFNKYIADNENLKLFKNLHKECLIENIIKSKEIKPSLKGYEWLLFQYNLEGGNLKTLLIQKTKVLILGIKNDNSIVNVAYNFSDLEFKEYFMEG